VEWLVALLGAIGLGALGNFAYELVKRGSLRAPKLVLRYRGLPAEFVRYNVRQDGLVSLVTWSRRRRLRRETLKTSYCGRPTRAHLFDDEEWRSTVAANVASGDGGRTCYITALELDHGEHERANECRIVLAESAYQEVMATHQLTKRDPVRARQLRDALNAGLATFLQEVPPTSLSFSVAVISPRGRVLALRRSLSVRTYANQWSIGINETMKYAAEPGASEDFYGLVERALYEELGLDRNEYGDIVITWLGWSEDASAFAGVAVVRARLSEVEVEVRRGQCHSVYEHDATAWLSLEKAQVRKVLERRDCPDGTSNWLYVAPLVILEVLRARNEF
jgi:predicted NUDIX family NTP pyrophosphohydrolase